MQQAIVAVVKDTPEVLMARLKREWEAIDAQKQAGEVDYDVKRAQALTEYMRLGLTQKEIGACVGIKAGWMDLLLRYGRFMDVLPATAGQIPEGRFRRYWAETVDHTYMSTLRGKVNQVTRADYERKVFQQIIEKVQEGQMPTVASTKRNKTVQDIKPAQLQSLRKEIQSYQVLKRKEVKDVYVKIEEDIEALIALSGCSRSTYAPNILAMHAKRLKQGLAALQQALNGRVDQWLLDILD